jgi:hypothetical protein
MIIPFARALSEQNNTQRDETRTDIHAWNGISNHKPAFSAANTFHALYCTTNLIGHYQIESPNLNLEIKL